MSDPHYRNNWKLERLMSGETVTGYVLHLPDGSELRYTHMGTYYFTLTEQTDPVGQKLTFAYDATNADKLLTITDADGAVTYLYYENGNLPYHLTRVAAPGGREVQLTHDTDGTLTNIVDAAGISSSFTYDGSTGWPISMTTPYGTTYFTLDYGASGYDRSFIATLPSGGKEAYMLVDVYSGMDWPAFSASQLPANTPFATNGYPYGTLDTAYRKERNTFYWNAQQFAALSTTNLVNFTWTEFKRGRIRHWLWKLTESGYNHVDTLGHQQDPSPDGTTEGQITWYDYAGKSYTIPERRGTQVMPAVIARVMPDGTTWWEWYKRNAWGQVTNQIAKWYVGSAAYYRTNRFIYDSTGVDLLEHRFDPGGANELKAGYGYDASHPHQPVRMTNALNEITYFTYDTSHRLSTLQTPGGLFTTNVYGSDGYLQKTIDSAVGGSAIRTNSFTWQNGLLKTQTDERNLTITNSWDALNRLTRVDYPDNTSVQHAYTNSSGVMLLDRTLTRDRLGFDTRYEYNSLRQLAKVTDARTNVTAYGYCTCGALEYVTNALNGVTHFVYDQQGRRTETYFPDNASVTNKYDLLGRVTVTSDALGSVTNTFDNLSRLVTVSNYFGQAQAITYDVEDHPLYVTDANGVTITNTYDNLDRLLTRTYPDGGVERFGYSALGLTKYTNQLSLVTSYGYDAAGRKTSETNANSEVISYTYNAASDLKTLTDGKTNVTTWNYDEYGRVTNKVDQASVEILRYKYAANSRLTNRWSKAKGDTAYSYDAVGNLTLVNYPSGTTDITLSYDALNRATNMVDAVGTTKYTYTASGNLLTEDGPFSSDTVTYTYHASAPRLRTALSLAQPTGSWTNGFIYDAAGRLTNVTSTAGTFSYAYKGVGALVDKLSLPNTSYITNVYDTVARLTGTYLKNSSHTTLNSHEYLYNTGHQRIRHTRTDASYYTNTYDNLGQLKVADSTVASEDRYYGYDPAWNLNKRTNNTTVYTFTVNGKNELTNFTGLTITYDNNGNLASRVYDSNGPKTYSYTYDAENQLTVMATDTYYTPSASRWKSEFTYDGRGRLRVRKEYIWYISDWSLNSETRYVYDGMRVIQERSSGNTPQVGYTRGTDLSGTMEGAGGIGGLLARSHSYSSGSFTTHNCYHADAGGNVTYIVNSSQSSVAIYKYDPYGNTISSSGTLASANVYRFSSKEVHVNSGMYYYGYRFYDPNLQRWLNRDPIAEVGFRVLQQPGAQLLRAQVNLYAFLQNDPLQLVDPSGLISWKGYVGVVCFGLGGVVTLATPAKSAGIVLMVVGGGLIIWDVVDTTRLIDKIPDWFQGGPNKDSDGDGMPDRLDTAPDDPNEH